MFNFWKKKKEPKRLNKRPISALTSKPAGHIYIEFDNNGEFSVSTDVYEMTPETGTSLAQLMLIIQLNYLSSYVFESLKLWSEWPDDGNRVSDYKKAFYVSVLQIVKDTLQASKQQQRGSGNPVIKASEVFRGKKQ
jgi:hypothetical protein